MTPPGASGGSEGLCAARVQRLAVASSVQASGWPGPYCRGINVLGALGGGQAAPGGAPAPVHRLPLPRPSLKPRSLWEQEAGNASGLRASYSQAGCPLPWGRG